MASKVVRVLLFNPDEEHVEGLRQELRSTGLEIQFVPLRGLGADSPAFVEWDGGHVHVDELDDVTETVLSLPESERESGRFDEIEVLAKDDGDIEVQMFPRKFVEVVEEGTPTKKNKDILVDIAKFNKRDPNTGEMVEELHPVVVTYTNDYDPEKVLEAIPKLFEKKYKCPLCEERAREIMGKVESIATSDMSPKEKITALEDLVARLEKLEEKVEEKEPTAPAPPPQHNPYGKYHDQVWDSHYQMAERFQQARDSVEMFALDVVEAPIRLLKALMPPPPKELFPQAQQPPPEPPVVPESG